MIFHEDELNFKDPNFEDFTWTHGEFDPFDNELLRHDIEKLKRVFPELLSDSYPGINNRKENE